MTIANRLRDRVGRATGNHHRSVATEKQLAANPPRPMSKGDMARALGTIPAILEDQDGD